MMTTQKSQEATLLGEMQMATFSLHIVHAIALLQLQHNQVHNNCRALRLATETAQFQIFVPPANMAGVECLHVHKEGYQTDEANESETIHLFVHRERLKLQTKKLTS